MQENVVYTTNLTKTKKLKKKKTINRMNYKIHLATNM